MQRIIFVNKESCQQKWIIPVFQYLLMFGVLVVLGFIF